MLLSSTDAFQDILTIFFTPQLMIVLCTKEYEHIISWTPEGDKFTIHNSKLLINEIFPKHFKQCKFPSFLRKVSFVMSTGELESLIFGTLYYTTSMILPLFHSFTDGDLLRDRIDSMVKRLTPQLIFIRYVFLV